MNKEQEGPMTVTLTPRAYWHLQWMTQRTPNELSAMGVLADCEGELRIEEFILAKQEVGIGSVDLDMEWWADKQAELYDTRGIEPWQTSCWCHTHPAGVGRPSATDNETMQESFGGWDFAIMLIQPRQGEMYCRLDYRHTFGRSVAVRLATECEVEVEWTGEVLQPVGQDILDAWERDYRELVTEHTGAAAFGFGWDDDLVWDPETWWDEPENGTADTNGKEDDYETLCAHLGLDPEDADVYEQFHGFPLAR